MDIVIRFIFECWSTMCQMAPYLLFGFLCAGLLSVLISPETVQRHLGGRGFLQVFKASLFGVPLPLCSCGVIPLFAALRKHGAGKGAGVSFLISTPQTGAENMSVIYSLLGPYFALFSPIAAFISGVFGGMMVDLFDKDGSPVKDVEKKEECSCHVKDEKKPCCESHARKESLFRRIFVHGFITLMDDVAKSLLVGILIASVISIAMPDSWFAGDIGKGLTGMLIMLLFGIPLYVCSAASIPIAAALVAKGVSPGAAFVFLMTGPVTNAASIAVVWKLIGRKATLIYLGSIVVSALVLGSILNSIGPVYESVVQTVCHQEGSSTLLQQLSAGALILLMSVSLVKPLFRKKAGG